MAPPVSLQDALPALLESVRIADRAVLDAARVYRLRPMEAYLLVALLDERESVSTAHLAARIAASSSQTKQLALALQALGLVIRRDRTGLTELTPAGREQATVLAADILGVLRARLGDIDAPGHWQTVLA